MGHPVIWLLAHWDWRADFLVHLREPALVASVAAAVAMFGRNRKVAAALAVLAAFQTWPLVRYFGANPVAPDPRSNERLRVLAVNVLVDNADHDRLAALIRRVRPDVVALVEYTIAWRAGLETVRREFPHRVEYPAGASGLAVWSKRPFRSEGPVWPWYDSWPAVPAELDFAGRRLRLWVVHPSSPLRRLGSHRGFPELDALAGRIQGESGPTLVVGDLNTSDASPHFGDFLATTGLRDSRHGFGSQPSWPIWSPYRIAIDHALLSSDLAVTDRRLGPPVGSDHLPLLIEVAPAAASRTIEARDSHASSSP